MPTVLIVRKSAIGGLPGPFREYVERYFVDRTVLGIQCAVGELHCSHPDGTSYVRWEKGVAPSHNVDVAHLGEVDGKYLNALIQEKLEGGGDDVFSLFVRERR